MKAHGGVITAAIRVTSVKYEMVYERAQQKDTLGPVRDLSADLDKPWSESRARSGYGAPPHRYLVLSRRLREVTRPMNAAIRPANVQARALGLRECVVG